MCFVTKDLYKFKTVCTSCNVDIRVLKVVGFVSMLGITVFGENGFFPEARPLSLAEYLYQSQARYIVGTVTTCIWTGL